MASRIRDRCVPHVIVVLLAAAPPGPLPAQNFRTVHSFNSSEGTEPLSGLALIGNTLYGTTYGGGTWNGFGTGAGTVFAVNTDGTWFQVLFNFPGDHANPSGSFAISDRTLYGTGYQAYRNLSGFIFSVDINRTNQFLNDWFDFEPTFGDGSQADGVIRSDNLLYGVTHFGGQFGNGTVYMYDGSTLTNLHSFAGVDGVIPEGSLILSNGFLYGVTFYGGNSDNGTVYALKSTGAGLATLHHFTGSTNGEGAHPRAGLILSGNILFGTTFAGGTSGNGTVFRVGTDGSGFATLHSFAGGSEGASPSAALALSGDTLYGTTYGGSGGSGTVFSLMTDGTAFRTLHSFGGLDGALPAAEVIVSGNTLYGTTRRGGLADWGTVFSLALPVALPQLTITSAGRNVVLTWPTNGAFSLQSASSLISGATWTRVLSTPVILNGLNTVMDPVSDTHRFYMLSQ